METQCLALVFIVTSPFYILTSNVFQFRHILTNTCYFPFIIAILVGVEWYHVISVSDFIFWGSKITADGDCRHEIKRRLLLGRKVMTNLGSTFKSRDIILPSKVHLVKAMVFPVVMYGCETWTVKKAEHGRIDAFELWCWRRLLRVPWTARRSNQSILKEISPGCFFGRNDAKAETPVLWPPHAKS